MIYQLQPRLTRYIFRHCSNFRARHVGQGGALPFLRELADAYATVASLQQTAAITTSPGATATMDSDVAALKERGASFLYSLVQLLQAQRIHDPDNCELADMRMELGTLLFKLVSSRSSDLFLKEFKPCPASSRLRVFFLTEQAIHILEIF
jgi:hypothetical protein